MKRKNPYLPNDPRSSIVQKTIIINQLYDIIIIIFRELRENFNFFKWLDYDKLAKIYNLLSTSFPHEKTFILPQKYELSEYEELPKVIVTKGEWRNFTGTVLEKKHDQILITFKLFGRDTDIWVKKSDTKLIKEDVSKIILEKKLHLMESIQNVSIIKLFNNVKDIKFLDKLDYQKIRAATILLQDLYGDWKWSVKK